MALIHCIGDNPMADAFAKEVAEILVPAYPNHSWWVECKSGVLIIKHLEASGRRGLIGMIRHMDKIPRGKGLRKELLRAGGELLERARLARGARTDDPVTGFDLDDEAMRKYWHVPLHGQVIH